MPAWNDAAQDSDLTSGSKKVLIAGKSAAHADSYLSTSTGDEAGTAGGGVVSSKIKGKCSFASSSQDVRIEGKAAVRFLDICLHNGNTDNTGSQPALGEPGAGLPDELDESCPSPEHASEHKEDVNSDVKNWLQRNDPSGARWDGTLGASGGGGFLSGNTATAVLPQGTILYRYFGGAARAMGAWWSRFPVTNPIAELALPQGNYTSRRCCGIASPLPKRRFWLCSARDRTAPSSSAATCVDPDRSGLESS